MSFLWFLAFRHLRYRRTQTLIILLGVASGIAVLITALSLTNGFSQGLIRATLEGIPDLVLQAYDPQRAPPPPMNPEIVAEAPFLATKALLAHRAQGGEGGAVDFATLIGLGPGGQAVYPNLNLSDLGPGRIVLGSALAQELGALPGSSLEILAVNQNRIRLQVAGTFQTGNLLLDGGYAFVSLSDLRRLLEEPHALTGWQLRLKDPNRAPQVGEALAGSDYLPLPWEEVNQTLIDQLALQKKVIGAVVFLIVIIAALGMANVLILVVNEKIAEIALLRVLGARSLQVAGVFGLEGLLLGAGGVALGNLLGYALSRYFQLHPLSIPGALYFLDHLPVKIKASDFLWVSLLSLAVVLLASLLPLLRALKVKPGEFLR